ncbi:response regulator [Neobacillus kokaensis]|uniref:DNA-binding response regulator n=1 Tax=Neobacillus kokaensis TaxID=2759023 RepID=A0ABQ3N8G9_9BACI|nr:response regulator [Neobacillus kokaensis]GHH99937.1 DNA-binding response regulator [Neobacillus kokaensis]
MSIIYKVLIVDDEMLARVGIKSLIPWEENGFVIEGEMENGKQAYEWMFDNEVDIVITDIKMPVMNGIELIRKTSKQNIATKFVVLSSYDDYEYVREALKNGAVDYLIKLELTPKLLLDLLKKVTLTIEQERPLNKQSLSVKKTGSKELTLLKETFFRDLLFGWIRSHQEYNQRLKDLNIEIPEGQIVCLMFLTEELEIYERYKDEETHLLNHSILNMLNEIISEYKFSYAVSTQTKEFVILHYAGNVDKEEAMNHADLVANTIRTALNQYLNISITIGVSESVQRFDEVKQAYRQVNQIVSQCSAFHEGRTVHFEMLNKLYEPPNKIDLTSEFKQLETAIKLYEDEDVTKILQQLKQSILHANLLSYDMLRVYCSTIIYHLSSRIEENLPSWMENQLLRLNKLTKYSDFIAWFEQLELDWSKERNKITKCSRLIITAQRFIRTNYSNDLTLESIADYLNLSPSYFSNLFKKETGENFIEYLTNIRINQAKILLRTTDLKIYEVGRNVGYDNEHYFSRVFKKVSGQSPLLYKSQL